MCANEAETENSLVPSLMLPSCRAKEVPVPTHIQQVALFSSVTIEAIKPTSGQIIVTLVSVMSVTRVNRKLDRLARDAAKLIVSELF